MTMHHNTLPFSPGIFWPKTTLTIIATHPTFLLAPIENKTERQSF
jgi:hypothetical protein